MKNKHVENFASKTFNKQRMKERLPYPTYLKWKDVVRTNSDLDRETADTIAHAMKEWALENGATHYSHWFQPLNGLTAKKQEAFLDRTSDADTMNRFSGKELIKGEPDASSFPSGGIRSTFEARGYTYWDCTANSFIIDNVLYIPTIFVSFNGEKLDKRAPLLASMNKISNEGSRLMNILVKDKHTYRMRPKIGLEQEFFLIDKKLYDKRIDLISCGRTLVGSRPPKGQELDDHYFGAIPKRVREFYEDVNEKLWGLGIYAKTEHNEVAPCQFEIAILFENSNISIDDNQLAMTILKETALEHGLVCLLHEKPFKGVNGSGKHNNYSLMTNYGLNCFDPGDNPEDNLVFLLFTSAIIKTTHNYQTLLRISSSSVSNDYRLGGDEAPPAIISLFLGQDIEDVFTNIANGSVKSSSVNSNLKVENLGTVPRDKSDRNRTSSVAFTGNKFEFRMLGSSKSAADINIVLNAAMAKAIGEMADRLENVPEEKLKEEVYKIVKEVIEEHGSIIYGGDNYSEIWINEAKERGLKNYKTFFEALSEVVNNKDEYSLLLEANIFSEVELKAIYEVFLEEVVTQNGLELRTLREMLVKDIIPSIYKEIKSVGETLSYVENLDLKDYKEGLNFKLVQLFDLKKKLDDLTEKSILINQTYEKAKFLQSEGVKLMESIREISDEVEKDISRENFLIPTYSEMFNSII